MIRIAIIQAASTLPLGNSKSNAKGQRLVWLDKDVVDRLCRLRRSGEGYNDVILQLAGESP